MAMFMLLVRLGVVTFGVGILAYFFTHSLIATILLVGIGYAVFMVGAVCWSLDSSGDASFS